MIKRKRVLVIDDDPAIRQLVSGIMVEDGYDAQSAIDGDHALRSTLALRPDLIILDVYLPEPSMALAFAESYASRVSVDQRAPIVVLSGTDDIEAMAAKLGASEALKKPFDVQELRRRVAKYLDPSTEG